MCVARLGLMAPGPRSAAEMAAHSRAALDRPLTHEAELWVATATDEARVLGAFQRAHDGFAAAIAMPLVRRGSGGPEVFVGPGTVHVALALARPGSLTECDEKHIVNRYVRPLLRALTATGSPAAFFGRDWISVSKKPAGWVGFGHDAASRRTLFEAFVAVTSPFALPERASFRGKAPSTLQSISGHTVDPARLVRAVTAAYAEAHDLEDLDVAPAADSAAVGVEVAPPWVATCQEAIGLVGAGPDGHGTFRVGGDFLVSRDALARLEARTALAGEDEIGRIVDETLMAPGVALDGIRTLSSLRDVIVRARRG
jgi:hypothetical protein